MTFPGPSLPAWGLELIGLAAAVALLGELVRLVGARWLPLLRTEDPIERGLLDLYLGGGALFVVAAFPISVFYPATIVGLLVLGGVGVAFHAVGPGHPRAVRDSIARLLAPLARPEYLITLLAAVGLFAIELSATAGVGSGNTFDSSLLGTYTGLLTSHHTLPTSLLPVANEGLSYPQGTTVWLATAQGLFGLPPLRTSLLVTPLFLALAPLGAFVAGRRLGGAPTVAVSFALVVAGLAAWPRELVGGSNDFVFALPLVLLLVGWSTEWLGPDRPTWATALAFGGLAGCAAALSPVGPVWLLLALPVAAALIRPAFAGAALRWASRWLLAVAASVLGVLPSLVALARFPASGGLGAGGTAPVGITLDQFLADTDPFLFGATDQSLSPFPLLRAELAILLAAGVIVLALGRQRFPLPERLGRFLLAAAAVAIGLLGGAVLAHAGVGPFPALFRFTNPSELSILLFIVYAAVAAVPLVVLLRELSGPNVTSSGSGEHRPPRAASGSRVLALVLVALVLVPGVAVSVGELPGQLHHEYTTFSNLTAADVDFLEWAPSHLTPGSFVVVGPGSAAGFLPAYDSQITLLFPMTVGFQTRHPAYWQFVSDLENGTYNQTALGEVYSAEGGGTHPFLIAVTENNTVLFRPLQPGPLLAASLPLVYHEGGVYLFAANVFPLPFATATAGGPLR